MQRNIGADPDRLRAEALVMIDQEAGRIRALYLTTVPGQESTYQRKLANCEAFLADTNPDMANYPWVDGESRAQEMNAAEAAQFVVDTATDWEQLGVPLEEARLTAKRHIREAPAERIASARQAGMVALSAFLPG